MTSQDQSDDTGMSTRSLHATKIRTDVSGFVPAIRTRTLCLGLLLVIAGPGTSGLAQEPAVPLAKQVFSKSTHTFKTADGIELLADVYRHEDEVPRPVIVWLHGGALILGTRDGVPRQLTDLAKREGYVVVSLDYRLAPEAQLPQIIEDLSDGLKWVRKSGPKLFHAAPARMVVTGASAGGYLALMSGIVARPPPTAIVSYWGFGDIDGDWTTKPSEAYRKGKLIDRDVALAGVGQKVLTQTNKETGKGRATFFLYLKQTGRWVHEVSGFDPEKDRDQLTPFCPVRNVSPGFPPTLFLHGTADNDVPVEQTYAMAAALKKHDVAHEVITIEGGGHSLWGGDRDKINRAFERSTEYIHEQLTGNSP